MEENEFKQIILKVEAVLFSYGDYISVENIRAALEIDSSIVIERSLLKLKDKYEGINREENENGEEVITQTNFLTSMTIEQNEKGEWRMKLKNEYENIVNDLVSNIEIPPQILKVLSVIAYEQPVSKTRLAEILGKSVKEEVMFLYKNKFVYYEKKGIGKYYKVTKKFFDYFKLEENEDFRSAANKNITEFLEETPEESDLENIEEIKKE